MTSAISGNSIYYYSSQSALLLVILASSSILTCHSQIKLTTCLNLVIFISETSVVFVISFIFLHAANLIIAIHSTMAFRKLTLTKYCFRNSEIQWVYFLFFARSVLQISFDAKLSQRSMPIFQGPKSGFPQPKIFSIQLPNAKIFCSWYTWKYIFSFFGILMMSWQRAGTSSHHHRRIAYNLSIHRK